MASEGQRQAESVEASSQRPKKFSTEPVGKLSAPRIVNLVTDPQEREDIALPYLHSWTATHFNKLIAEFHASIRYEPLIAAGAPLEFVPSAGTDSSRHRSASSGPRSPTRFAGAGARGATPPRVAVGA
jgi:hypothetical protein